MRYIQLILVTAFVSSCSSNPVVEVSPKVSPLSNKSNGKGKEKKKSFVEEVVAPQSEIIPDAPKSKIPEENYEKLARQLKVRDQENFLKQLSENLSLNSKDSRTWNYLGMHYLMDTKPLLARMAFRKGLEGNPESSSIYNNLGVSYLMEEDFDLAAEHFRKALTLDEGNLFSNANLGALSLRFGLFEEAESLFSKSKSVLKTDKAKFLHAQSLAETKNFTQANSIFEELTESKVRSASIYFAYASTLAWEKKDLSKARQLLNRVKILSSDSQLLRATDELLGQISKIQSK